MILGGRHKCGYSMVLDHTNKYIKLRGIRVKFAWFQHPLPPDFRGDLEHNRILDLREGASIFFCTYLIFACNIDFFMAGCPLSILKKIWEMWDFSRRKYGTNIGFLGSF